MTLKHSNGAIYLFTKVPFYLGPEELSVSLVSLYSPYQGTLSHLELLSMYYIL